VEDGGLYSSDPDHCKDARGTMLLIKDTANIGGDEKVCVFLLSTLLFEKL
jgi:hypothetical protein